MLEQTIDPLLFNQSYLFAPSFLGVRDYIDISQISREFFKHISPFFAPEQLKQIHIQISKPITHDGQLRVLRKNEHGAIAKFSAEFNGVPLVFGFFPGDRRIERRWREEDIQLSNHIEVDDGVLHLKKSFSDFSIYLLMCLGKATVLANLPHAIPKVASYYMPHCPPPEKLVGLKIKMTHMPRSFAKLDMHLHEEYLGYVMVKI